MFGPAAAKPRKAHQRRAASKRSARRISREPYAVDRNADQAGGPLVEAHPIDPASPGGGVQDKTREEKQWQSEREKRQGNPGNNPLPP